MGHGDTRIRKHGNTETQGRKDTETLTHRGTAKRRHGDTKIQKHGNTKTRKQMKKRYSNTSRDTGIRNTKQIATNTKNRSP